jgi:tripartite-type tricarboxylate transporter receptor subunit TctC
MKSFIACVLSALVAATAFAQASGYPDRPIKLVVGYSPGGGTDIVARLLANKVGGSLGQAIVVENRPGASGMVAAGQVAKAKPDGYTLMMGVVSLNAILPSLFASLPFDPVKDFVPVTLTGSVPHIIVVHPSLPVHSVGELIAYAKANPGIANFPSAGNGTTPHIAGELFKHMAGVNLVHIPYKSSGQSIPDLIAGRVTVGFDTYPAAAPLVRTGQVRAIAVTSADRVSERTDGGRVRSAWLSIRDVVRNLRTRRYAAGNCHQASRGVQRRHEVASHPHPARRNGFRRHRHALARRVLGAGEKRSRPVREARQGNRHHH